MLCSLTGVKYVIPLNFLELVTEPEGKKKRCSPQIRRSIGPFLLVDESGVSVGPGVVVQKSFCIRGEDAVDLHRQFKKVCDANGWMLEWALRRALIEWIERNEKKSV
jgi:hypothetical protein